MPNNIEKLQQESQAIKEELDVLKVMAQSSEKEKKRSELESRIQRAKQEIQTEYQQKLDQNVREKIKTEQEKLETFSSELSTLWNEVNSANTISLDQGNQDKLDRTSSVLQEQGEKGIWSTTKDFVSEQWKDIRDKEKWKEEWWKNALRTAGFLATGVGAVALVYKGIKALLGSDAGIQDQENSDDVQKNKEKSAKKETSWRKKWLYIAGGALGLGWLINQFSIESKDENQNNQSLKLSKKDQNSDWWSVENNEEKGGPSKNISDNQKGETVGDVSRDSEWELTPQEQEATEKAQKMYSEGYMDWYILLKMYQMGFVPKFNMQTWRGNSLKEKFLYIAEWGPFTKILDKGSVARKDLINYLKGTLAYGRDELFKKKAEVITKGDLELSKQIDKKANILAELHQDLENGKITSLKDIEWNTKYKAQIEEFGKIKFKNFKWKVELQFDETMKKLENSEFKTMESELQEMQKKLKSNLAELDKKAQADPKQKAKLQSEAKALVKNYNKKCIEIEQKFWIQLSKATSSEILQLQKHSPMVSKIMKVNNGVDNFLKKSKAWKFMVGAGVLTLLINGTSGKTSRKQVGLEAADLGTWFIPFAGGAYDVWTSITGEGIAGELSTTDRWVRGVAGGASVVLDVVGLFTFGAGNVLSAGLKWLTKWTTAITKTVKTANKVGKTVKTTAEVVNTAVKVAGFGFLWYSLVQDVKPLAVNLYETADKKLIDDISIQ